ncbi:helix-turn-helix transcriptional regulator [Salinibacter grassmerensis]|uniref:helix-turn-helix transcriptional regulator n=1 Tax=Salinibacter grassmerensis TaxID=3040353 RepID=UPI0021E95F25|nr:WYL domain-containing transcriptional regulator [Salinibacter grassmerensis]
MAATDHPPSSYDPDPPTRVQLHKALSRGRQITQSEASDELGVSKRRVRDVVKTLREEGVPVQEAFEDRRRVYYLKPGDWHSEAITLNIPERQLLTLLVATQAARPTLSPTPLAEDLDAASASLEEALGGRVVSFIPAFESERWHFSRATSVGINPDVFWALKRAIADRHPVYIDYYSASRGAWSRDRKIDPLMFAVRRGAWLCVAYCHKRDATIDFNQVGIEQVEVAEEEHFAPPYDFDRGEHFEGRFGALAGGDAHEVVLWVDDEHQSYFERKLYHPTQDVSSTEEGIEVTFRVQGLDEIASFILSWGSGVEVRSPEALKDRLVQEAKAVADQYA